LRIWGEIPQLFANAGCGIADSLNGALQFFAGYAEVPNPVFDLILAGHGNLGSIRHNPRREAASHERLHCAQILLSRAPSDAHLARYLVRRAATFDLVYFMVRVWRQPLLICGHTSGGTEPHVPVAMHVKSQLAAAVVAAYRACSDPINVFGGADKAAYDQDCVHWSTPAYGELARFDFKSRKKGRSRRSRSMYCRSRTCFGVDRSTDKAIS
jgi:hypothetical protein